MIFFIVFIACCILLLLAEVGVRARHYVKYGGMWGIEDTFTKDELVNLRVLIPNKQSGSVSINSHGFRGPEIRMPKPDTTIRIAFLGASTTYCAEVSSNKMVWPHLVNQKLKQHWPNLDFDYINGGVPGYGLNSSLPNLKYKIKPLEPDIIIIYHAPNDLSFNSFQLAKQKGLVKQRTGKELYWLSEYSLLSFLVEKNLRVLIAKKNVYKQNKKLNFNEEELAEPFRKELKLLIEESKKVVSVVAIATFTQRLRADQTQEEQLEAVTSSLYYMPYMTIDGLLKGFKAYNNVIRDVAKESNILLIDDNEVIPGDGTHFNDSVHFKDLGSKAMAQRVFNGLVEENKFQEYIKSRSAKKGRWF